MAAKAKTEKKAYLGITGLTAKKLNSIAEELNTALGITPAIDVENLEDDDLLAAVKTTMEVDVYSNDDLSDDVWALMKELGIEAKEPEDGDAEPDGEDEEEEKPAAKKSGKAKAAPKEDKKAPGKAKSKPKDEEPEDEPEEGEDEEEEKPAPKAKGKDKKEDKKPAPKAKEDKKPAKAAPKEKESRYTRMDAFATALLEGKKDKKTAETVFGRADELYVENTGKDSNLRESAWACKHALNALAACGYIEYDGTDITILVRPS